MTADSDLRRTHPATMVVKTANALWQLVIIGITFIFFSGVLGDARRIFVALSAFAVLFLFALVAFGFSWLSWLFFYYGTVEDHLVIREGWLVRKRRSIPLNRVQGVDVRAGVVSRVLGVADVVVQTAGGGAGEPEAKIGSVTLGEAERLRSELLHARRFDVATEGERVVGADPVGRMSDLRGAFGGVEQARVAPSFELRVPVPRLALAAVTSRSIAIVFAATIGLTAQLLELPGGEGLADEIGRRAAAAGVIAVLVLGLVAVVLTALIGVAVTVSRDFGFVARRVDDRIETEAGLFERRMTGMPVSRIQTVTLEEAPLRRLLGWGAIQVATAGFGRGEEQKSTTSAAIVPIARRSEIEPVMHALLPEAERFPVTGPLPRAAWRFYVIVPTFLVLLAAGAVSATLAFVWPQATYLGLAGGAILSALVAGWQMLAWKAAAYGADDAALAIVSGVLGRYRTRIGRSRIQSLTVRQNPFQKRAGLATLVAASVSGSSKSLHLVRHLPLAQADRLITWYGPDSAVDDPV